MPQAILPAQSRPLRSPAKLASIITTVYDRIERDRRRNCWIYVRPMEEALAEADALVQRAEKGEALPLLGVPFGVKDNIDVEDMPTTAACPSFEYVAAQSARCVERLTAAGAICLGKTNLDQFATGLSGTRSPYGACSSVANDLYVSGGSSSGSAVLSHPAMLPSLSAPIPAARAGFLQASMGSLGSSLPSASSHPRGLVPDCPTLDCPSIFCNSIAEGRNTAWVDRRIRRHRSFQPTADCSVLPVSSQVPVRPGLRRSSEFIRHAGMQRPVQAGLHEAFRTGRSSQTN